MLVQTATIEPGSLNVEEQHQTYCALDSMLTLEILENINREHPGGAEPIYSFERALQAPLLEMALHGFLVDGLDRHRMEIQVKKQVVESRRVLNELAQPVWGKELNPRSHAQLSEFFYKTMKIPEIWLSFKGERRLSVNREALEKIDEYMYARPLVSLILSCRDLYKQLDVLTEEIDEDGRHRTSYNIGGTETGRLSSSTSVLGTGGNAQNIAPELRRVFISDPGWKLCSIDLEQVEARDVGFLCGSLFGDWSLLDSCESGDLHTNNCKLIWRDQKWPASPSECRALAERFPVYHGWTMRDLAKRGGHLTNYNGTAWTMSRVLKLPIKVCADFQARYCRGSANSNIRPAYPALRQYWTWIADRLQTEGHITTPFGRKRHFFGDQRSDATLREAIAFVPQSMTADRTNLWLWKVWSKLGSKDIQLLAQTHDSITFQFPDKGPEIERSVIEYSLELLNEIRLVDSKSQRVYITPGEAKIGWNWAPVSKDNPGGLRKWKKGVHDERTRPSGLERLLS
jgi:DNA polymerase I-like protein with 3'-5' exonuclease and polymerase domains